MTRRPRRRGRSAAEPGWFRAQSAVTEAFAAVAPHARTALGRVRSLGRGLFREGWWCDVALEPDPDGWSGEWVALVPLPGAPADSGAVRAEARILTWLATQPLPIRVPRVVPPVSDVLICGWLAGGQLDQKSEARIALTAEVARAIHALAPPDFLPGYPTRRAHAAAELARLARFDDPLLREALAWGGEHLPPDAPASLLHGDFMAQNVLFHFHLPPAVIDWAGASGGDPASDLAIVTRGARRPFGEEDGLQRLVRAVDPEGERIAVAHVRIHELGLLSRWVPEDSSDGGNALNHLRNLARRLVAG